MSKIINTMVMIIMLGRAALSFVVLKFDDTTAAIKVLAPRALHFLPRVARHTVRASALHPRRVLRSYFITSNRRRASSCRKIINTTATIIALNCATLGTTIGFAHAGICTDQITQLRRAAQIAHRPTLGYAKLMFSAELTRAEAMDAEGNEEACLPAVSTAMQYFAVNQVKAQ